MSHTTVTVCLAPATVGETDVDAAGSDVQQRLAVVMAPHKMDEGVDWKWDGWAIAAPAVSGGYRVRPEHVGDPLLVQHSAASAFDDGRCAGGPKFMLDLDADRHLEREAAARRWSQWQDLVDRSPRADPLRHFLDRRGPGYDLDQAHLDHARQPLVTLWLAGSGLAPGTVELSQGTDPVTVFGYDREDYLARCVSTAIPTGALLDLEGVWIDEETFGDFGDHSSFERYFLYADDYIERLAPDVVVVQVYIHY